MAFVGHTFIHSPQRTHLARNSLSATAPGGRMSMGLKVRPCEAGGTLSITAAAAPEPAAVRNARRPTLCFGRDFFLFLVMAFSRRQFGFPTEWFGWHQFLWRTAKLPIEGNGRCWAGLSTAEAEVALFFFPTTGEVRIASPRTKGYAQLTVITPLTVQI